MRALVKPAPAPGLVLAEVPAPSAAEVRALVRRIVEDHGGRMELETAPGEGTTFTVLLPVRRLDA